ncbi:hypothetical protein ElyMa_005483700 [Elysia marginata]|uniref:Uncharacterized protein n=1 Tax=Elysia marginata TaxID=1093978 RepID=A0AAV4ERU7_9GAST|nr:hypothetical protein ElyMa_005483700 [Elysia marginata]
MKLKELVANSLPRVRGKKKKSSSAGGCTAFSHSSSPKPGEDLPLSSPASVAMATSSFTVSDDWSGREQLSSGQTNGQASFSSFFPAGSETTTGRNKDPQTLGLVWHGNALYRGPRGSSTERVFSQDISTSLKVPSSGCRAGPYRGMSTSHSAEGISLQHLMAMSRSGHDARMAVSEYAGSCASQMSVISESAVEAYSAALRQRQHYHHHQQQQHHLSNLSAHYHQHSHQHFHHYHHHHNVPPSRAMPLTQQPPPGQRLQVNKSHVNSVHDYANSVSSYAPPYVASPMFPHSAAQQWHAQTKGRNGKRQELGFFRKSFASFKSIRKHTSSHGNHTIISPATGKPGSVAPLTRANLAASEHLRCSVCPYPDEGGVASTTVTAALLSSHKPEVGPVKPKRRGLRGLSKSKSKKITGGGKENRSKPVDSSSCFSDSDAHSMLVAVGQPITDLYPSWDRAQRKQGARESFYSARVCADSREGSCYRDLDPTCLDSTSLSGYDSDFPRGTKVHRSRSRIRTNPWLPSPQPSLGVDGGNRRCGGASELRESQEDVAVGESFERFMPGASISRSASFEHRRPATLKSLTSSYHPGCQKFSNMDPDAIKPELEKNFSSSRCHDVPHSDSKSIQRPLTPSVDPDSLVTMSLDRPQKTKSPVGRKWPWWSFGRRNSKKENNNIGGSAVSATQHVSTPPPQHATQNVYAPLVTAGSPLTPASSLVNCAPSLCSPTDTVSFANRKVDARAQSPNQKLNDLNMETAAQVVRTRPRSIVSPNSEFILLAGHLEQLAHNISFEYEDVLDSVDSVSLPKSANCNLSSNRTQQSSDINLDNNEGSVTDPSLSELSGVSITNSENNHVGTSFCNSGGLLSLNTPESPFSSTSGCSLASPSGKMSNPAHSPDSGVGGLGSTDGDLEVLSTTRADTASCSSHVDQAHTPLSGLDQTVSKQLLDSSIVALQETQVKMLHHDRSENQPSSFSSGQDDDSSATISESDVDNTHYHDGSVLQKPFDLTSSSSDMRISTSEEVNPSPLKNNFHNQNMAPVISAAQLTASAMGSRASILKHSGTGVDTMTSGLVLITAIPIESTSKDKKSVSGASKLRKQSHSRSFVNDDTRWSLDNNSNDCLSDRKMHNSSKLSESMVSSNGTLPPFPGSLVRTCHLDAAVVLEENLRLVRAPSVEDFACFVEDCLIPHNHLQNSATDTKRGRSIGEPSRITENEDKQSHTKAHMGTISSDLIGIDSTPVMNASFDMTDACVQTDFEEEEEDYARLGESELGALESLEFTALDPAESTRRWLLTGNMQGSADTGYASQTRDSQIFMDDVTRSQTRDSQIFMDDVTRSQTRDSQIFMDDVTRYSGCESKLPLFSCYTDRTNSDSSEERTPRNSMCFDNDLYFETNHPASPSGLRAFLEEGPVLYKPSPALRGDHAVSAPTQTALWGHQKQHVSPKTQHRSNRSISPFNAGQTFSNIEHEFEEEMFQQHQHPHGPFKSQLAHRKRFSDSSDSTLESESSRLSSYSGGAPVGELHDVAARYREILGESRSLDHEDLSEPETQTAKHGCCSEDSPKMKLINKVGEGNKDSPRTENPQVPLAITTSISHARHVQPSQLRNGCNVDREQNHPNPLLTASSSRVDVQISPNTDRADYLEVLLDAPLDRPNLKRPLFLVPRVSAVDTSSPDTMCSDSRFYTSENQRERSCGLDQGMCETFSSVRHMAKKIRFKEKHACDKKRSPHCEDNKSVTTSSTYAPRDAACNKTRSVSALDKKAALTGQTNKRTKTTTPSGLSFENKSYQSLGENSTERPAAWESFSVTDRKDTRVKKSHHRCHETNDTAQVEEDTRILAERVKSLQREKDEVYRKLQAAQLDELTRKGNLEELRRHAQNGHKNTLLRTLRDLRDKLESQKRLLQEKKKPPKQV